ncbi:uncharacterized protein LOC106639820 isoform X2 [Copidosoma floridanum]|uniref:uncharacterized protein LOC106639820 isoform X2 n=1 Tax=Copidosoma floridanum TaxID=29053 RepID=UPI0006C96F70|nr:uncharacterized protein LOC106639820 isoform X2 [Copidosoma floridanum]
MTLPKLPLDIAVPSAVLCRRGGISLTGLFIKLRQSSEAMVDCSREQSAALMLRISEETKDPDALALQPNGSRKKSLGKLDELERLLLSKLDASQPQQQQQQPRSKHTGRFLTMHKRRRKRLVTRSLDQDPALLDDVSHGQVQCVLQRVANWNFNAFTLENATGGRSLSVVCVHLFHWYGLLEHFNLDVVRVWKLFTLIEEGYHSTNPYHNSIHAADVTQAMHCFLQVEQIRRHLSYMEIMASLIAAVTHDLDHPGVNQPFLVATRNHLAALYGNKSVLENHHWRSAVCCLLESGVLEQLPDSVKPELQQHISSLILATDITRQQEFLARLRRYLDDRELDMQRPEHRHFILQIALKCADISNPCRPWDISRKWAYKVCEEFFRQGDYERQLSLPITPSCDRHITSIPKIQVGFFKFVVLPLYEEWHRFLNDSFSHTLMKNLHENECHWETLLQEELAVIAAEQQQHHHHHHQIEPQAEVTVVHDASECTTEDDSVSLELSATVGLAPPQHSDGRRHSVPLGVSRSMTLAPRPTTGRRESLPGAASLVPSRISSRSSLQRSDVSPSGAGLNSLSMSLAVPERPVSAENLLPDTSIASIANSLEASKLSSLVQQQQQLNWEQQLIEQQPVAARQGTLTRQQTFPPVQPFSRMRYMSTTAEMSQCCPEVLLEADSSSSRSTSPAPTAPSPDPPPGRLGCSSSTSTGQGCATLGAELRRHSTPAQTKSRSVAPGTGRRFTTIPLTQEAQKSDSHKVFFIGSPPDSPPRHTSATPSSDSGSGSVSGEPRKSVDSVSLPGNKRDYSDTGREKSSKILKLMKENVDPRVADDLAKGSHVLSNRRSSNQGLARRRGSAPVGLMAKLDDLSTTKAIDPCSRRGSVPADITAHPNGGVNRVGLSIRTEKLSNNKRRSSLPHETALGNLLGNLVQLAAERENYNNNNNSNNNNNNNNNTGSNNNGFSRLSVEVALGSTPGAILNARRGSVPADISELRRDLFGRSSFTGGNGKSRNTRSSKKLLRRRSSGGPEMFASGADGNDNGAIWPSSRGKRDFIKREEPVPLLAKRRGSLPVEMLALSFTGRYIHR